MKFIGKSREVAEKIIQSFQTGNIVQPLKQVFFTAPGFPSASYSWGNRFVISLSGLIRGTNYTGAGSFKWWQEKNRHVKKGERAIHILAPLLGKKEKEDPNTGEKKNISFVYGFKSVPVFAYEQTEGAALPELEEQEEFLKTLPFCEVAKAWGIRISVDTEKGAYALGYFAPNAGVIGLAVKNKSTWAHELVHAADSKLQGGLKPGQVAEQEVIAEFGGAVLLSILGDIYSADVGGAWEYIQDQAGGDQEEAIRLSIGLIDRVCACVNHIVEKAQELAEQKTEKIAA
ncbi:hypothetical protein C4588_05770 [Candidatus Parcubacteria bacterium]|nr:MAG: hypothetical protein C4588_05770 [Candidatus Parcubacteria bacterium]